MRILRLSLYVLGLLVVLSAAAVSFRGASVETTLSTSIAVALLVMLAGVGMMASAKAVG